MTPVEVSQGFPGAQPVMFAAGQPQYRPLPALRSWGGDVWTEWEFTPEERAVIAAGGRVRLHIKTFNDPLQPMRPEVVPAPGATQQEHRDAAASSVSPA